MLLGEASRHLENWYVVLYPGNTQRGEAGELAAPIIYTATLQCYGATQSLFSRASSASISLASGRPLWQARAPP